MHGAATNGYGTDAGPAGRVLTHWKAIVLLARRSLLLVLAALLLGGAGWVALQTIADRVQVSARQLQDSVSEQRRQLQARRSDLNTLQGNMARFLELRDKGLVGSAHRTLWVEQLEDAFRQAGLPGELRYQLETARPLIARQEGVEPAATSAAVLQHDLQFEVRGVHEAEVLELIRNYRDRVKGRFRVNSCKLSDPTPSGLTAQCVLRFLTVAEIAATSTTP